MSKTGLTLPIDIEAVKGFMDPVEGAALHDAAFGMADRGPVMEIGSYCGKSTVYLGAACKARGALLYALDHHRGSEENQPGWEHHDPGTWDAKAGAMDTLPFFRDTLRRAGLEDTVIAIVTKSRLAARHWNIPLSMLFIDGGHALEMALIDYRGFSGHVMQGGILAIHDIFPDPRDGGQAPYEIYRLALASGMFEELAMVKSLGLLRRILV
ncbi:MAG: MMP 1-O-methyltransferase [Alphaproteobacteria bacterium]|nr:MMP 1-O-methyltransferase [Alphaproteobacteria bacterium]